VEAYREGVLSLPTKQPFSSIQSSPPKWLPSIKGFQTPGLSSLISINPCLTLSKTLLNMVITTTTIIFKRNARLFSKLSNPTYVDLFKLLFFYLVFFFEKKNKQTNKEIHIVWVGHYKYKNVQPSISPILILVIHFQFPK
jgi:hypothetical protein